MSGRASSAPPLVRRAAHSDVPSKLADPIGPGGPPELSCIRARQARRRSESKPSSAGAPEDPNSGMAVGSPRSPGAPANQLAEQPEPWATCAGPRKTSQIDWGQGRAECRDGGTEGEQSGTAVAGESPTDFGTSP
eukprot:scaffold241581_cov28-Tisochrysis_lutea.AAC.4